MLRKLIQLEILPSLYGLASKSNPPSSGRQKKPLKKTVSYILWALHVQNCDDHHLRSKQIHQMFLSADDKQHAN